MRIERRSMPRSGNGGRPSLRPGRELARCALSARIALSTLTELLAEEPAQEVVLVLHVRCVRHVELRTRDTGFALSANRDDGRRGRADYVGVGVASAGDGVCNGGRDRRGLAGGLRIHRMPRGAGHQGC